MIDVQQISKSFGDHWAVKNLSFQIQPGEVVGLLGQNGAGKTTTMRLLTGFMPPTSGNILISGHHLSQQPRLAKKNIGYLPEIPPLYPELTVEEMLELAASLQEIKPAHRRQKIEKVLESTGLQHVRHRVTGNLSKGYRQRVGIAMAIVHEPSFLILDEPTVGLDPKQITEIRDLIVQLKQHTSILISSHILQEISLICDRVLVIHQGQLVADKSIQDIHTSRKKVIVSLSSSDEKENKRILEEIGKISGVQGIDDYASGLEDLFLNLTQNQKVAP